jgi:pimeloyl-ACP methyl ester carboxylesterase
MDGQGAGGSSGEAAVKAAIETREVITVGASGGLRLRGTYHKPQEVKFDSRPEPDEENPVGVLFVSAGVSPRAALGDAAVYWADSLAKCGYPCFRFDLPGLGDSDGDLSAKEIDFDSLVDEGVFGPVVSGMADDLVERFHLRGVVVIGHCAGAVTALYSAAANKRIKGIVLLDPHFHAQPGSDVQNVLVRSQLRIVRKLVGGRPEPSILRDAAVKFLCGIRNIYHRLEHIRRFVRRKRLPSAANLPLIRCWNQLATSGIPMLVLRSPLSTPKPGEFDYVTDLQPLSDQNCRISVKLIERATHSFAERHSKEAVLKYAEQWLSASFSPTSCAETRNTEHRSAELAAAISGIDKHVH